MNGAAIKLHRAKNKNKWQYRKDDSKGRNAFSNSVQLRHSIVNKYLITSVGEQLSSYIM